MTAPRRSKRIQALNRTNEDSRRVAKPLESLEGLEAPKNYHPKKRRRTTESQHGTSEGLDSKSQASKDVPKRRLPKNRSQKKRLQWSIRPPEQFVSRLIRIKAELEKKQADKAKEQQKENRRKVEQSRRYLHEVLALDRKDGYAQQFWSDLASSIKYLGDEFRFWDKPWDDLGEDLQQKFLGYAPNIEELFDVPDMAPLVFQRWLWEVIDENFFSKKSKDIVWASPFWEAQGTMERYLQEHDFPYDDVIASHMFPHWRYTTMQFYMSLKDSPRESQRIDPTCVVPITAKAVGQYFPQEPNEESMKNEYSTILKNLSDAVVKMDFFFSANLTVFSHVIHHPETLQTCGFPYSPKLEGVKGMSMRAISGSDAATGRTVDLVVEPMLQRRGDPLGFDYNVKTAVHPMKVCVAWLQDPNRPRLSEMERGVREQEDEEAGGSKQVDEKVDKEEEKVEEEEEEEEEESKQSIKEITKERVDKEVDKGEEEGDLTKQEEKKTNTKNTTKSKKTKKRKQKRRQQ
ncbi:hypothetical protein J7337_009336 [Fusarium musae]|uniref:Uncharacterized protein n=1 Tax=Fusarium musae TaxID=1042133 RepID=A0A9P8IM61_9HYPO|nr:hypothetical protein J7337_009336 [Fusarium musae]KAG9498529.1 hypothetical protein J7337_009336 [Fusarium musae]